MLDIRKRAAFSDLLLAVTALGAPPPNENPHARPQADPLLRRSVTGPMPRHRRLCASSDIRDRGADGLRVGARRRHRRALVGIVPSAVLKLGLGVILIVSAWRTFHHSQQPAVQTAGAPAT